MGRLRLATLDLGRSVSWTLALIGFIVGARTITDNSFLTHLATGRLILAERAVPSVDPYSYLAGGRAWTVQSWLVSVVYAGLDDTLGGWSIRILNGLVGVAIALGLWRLVAPAGQLVVRVALVSLAVLTGTYLWPPRPLLFGLLAMVLVLQVVQGLRPQWWLLPVFWLWVNSHGSFVLGLVMMGTVSLGAAIDQRRWPSAEARMMGLATLGCLLGALNPVGWRLLWFPVQLLGRRQALDRVSEWKAPTFHSVPEQLFLVLLVLIVLGASRRCRWRELLPALTFFVSGLLAIRNLGLASVVIVVFVAPALEGLVGQLDGTSQSPAARLLGVTAGFGLVMAIMAVTWSPTVELDAYPEDEVDWLEARSLIADETVVVAQRDFVGNYLTLRYGPRARVFMDDRFDFYPLDVIADHNALVLGGDMAEVLQRRHFDVVLWEADSPLYRWLEADPSWDIVRQDDAWFVACRVASSAYERCSSV